MGLREISIVMPVFNEAAGITPVLNRLAKHVATLTSRYEVEIILVDDGSNDGTHAALQRYSDANPDAVRVVRHDKNAGLVAAMRTGAEAARSETVVFLDADLSYEPEIVEPLVRARFLTNAKAALASPYMPGGRVANVPVGRLIASRGANWILTRCTGGRLHTLTGMVRAYERETFLRLFDAPICGEFNTWATAVLLRAGHVVTEIPAALVWPPERAAAPSRLTPGQLWERTTLVFKTARILALAARSAQGHAATGTFGLPKSPHRPYSAK
jgi:dolichol-phosphate mannosyltransferase